MDFKIRDAGLRFFRPNTPRTQPTTHAVLHHFHHETATVQDVHRWHQNRNPLWNGIGYSVVVYKNGEIWLGRGLDMIGAHTVNYNSRSIGIGFQGRYDDRNREMPDAQFNAGVWLLRYIQVAYPNIIITDHGALRPTACAGRFFPLAEMQALKYRGDIEEENEMTLEKLQEEFPRLMSAYLNERNSRPISQWAADEGFWDQAGDPEIAIRNGEAPQGFMAMEW